MRESNKPTKNHFFHISYSVGFFFFFVRPYKTVQNNTLNFNEYKAKSVSFVFFALVVAILSLKMDEDKGFGKVILFGEHFVVYSVEAIVAAVSSFTSCTIRGLGGSSVGMRVIDERPAVPGYKTEKQTEMDESLDLVLKWLKVSDSVSVCSHLSQVGNGIEVTFGGDLVCTSGIGASASQCCSFSRALSRFYSLNLNEEEVNRSAYEGEKGYHGTPSGIDNTAATFGGLLTFKRHKGAQDQPTFHKIECEKTCRVVVAATGLTASTTVVVGDVRKFKEAQPDVFDALLKDYSDTVMKPSERMLKDGDWEGIGRLCDHNHQLLQKLTVSCEELDACVKIAKDNGALGAKMCGTGRGGIIIAITPSQETQDKVAEALTQSGKAKFLWKYEIGGN